MEEQEQWAVYKCSPIIFPLMHALLFLPTPGADPGFQKGGGWMADHIY